MIMENKTEKHIFFYLSKPIRAPPHGKFIKEKLRIFCNLPAKQSTPPFFYGNRIKPIPFPYFIAKIYVAYPVRDCICIHNLT